MKKFILVLFVLFFMSKMTFAQNALISLELKDAPVRSTLEMVFKQAKIKNYVIEADINGFITMSINEHPFENTLKLIMRASTVPLTYIKENDVYIIKTRKAIEQNTKDEIKIVKNVAEDNVIFEKIPLTFIDPMDLQILFGPILNINQFTRYRMNRFGNSMGNNFGNNNFGGFGSGRNF